MAARGAKRARREARREAEAEKVGEGGEEGIFEEDEGQRGRGRAILHTVTRTQGQRKKALDSEAAAGRIQGRLDGKGLDVGEVERRMEQARI